MKNKELHLRMHTTQQMNSLSFSINMDYKRLIEVESKLKNIQPNKLNLLI